MSTSAGILNVIIGASISDFMTKMQIADRQMSKSKGSTIKASAAIKTAMIGALSGVATASISMAMDFERSLTKMRTLAGASAKDIDGFRKSILSLVGETGRAPQELADALYFITSSGLEGEEALLALKASAQAAAIGMGDTQVVADGLTSILNAYGHEAYTAAEATNILLRTVKLGKAEADQLAASIGQVVPTAAQLGLSFEEVGAALSAITLTGKNASEAVTGVNSILTALMTTSTEGEKRLGAVKLSFESLRNTLRTGGLSAMLKVINENFGDNVEAISDILGRKEAISSYFSLVGEGAENYAKALEMAADQTNELAKATAIYADSAPARWDKVTASISSFGIMIGNVLSHAAMSLIDPTHLFKVYVQSIQDGKDELIKLRDEANKTWEDLGKAPTAPTGLALLGFGVKKQETPEVKTGQTEDEFNENLKKQIALMKELDSLMSGQWHRTQEDNEKLAKKMTRGMKDFNREVQRGTDVAPEFIGEWENAGTRLGDFFRGLSTKIMELAQTAIDRFGWAFDFIGKTLSDLQSLFSDFHQNRMNDLTAQEKRELDSYEAKYKGAENYEEGLTALMDFQQERREEAQAEYAKKQKKLAMFQAILAGAVAQLAIWADLFTPTWAKIAMSAVVAGITGAQIAAINGATIPGFASGGIMPHSGAALVGERGPEVVNLPMGSSITPNHLLGGGNMKTTLDREEFVTWAMQGSENHRFRRAGR